MDSFLPVIAVIAFHRISPFLLSVPCVIFGERHPGVPPFELIVCGVEQSPLITTAGTAGFSIHTDYALKDLERAQVIIVPSWRDPDERPPQDLLDALVVASQRGAQIVGLCLGAYVLAEAGLLDGHSATTHWAYTQDFARRYPKVQFQGDKLYIAEGLVMTSAGATAGIDCCIHLLRQRFGVTIANSVARRLVMPSHRQGEQMQFIAQPIPESLRNTRLPGLIDWIRANLPERHTLDTLSKKCLMSRRTFSRTFKQSMGTTLGQWLIHERLLLAQRLLESTDQSIEQIAALAGFGSPISLRHHFHLAFGVSPKVWRYAFRKD